MNENVRKGILYNTAVIALCFLLTSTGYLAWVYNLAKMVSPQTADALTMVAGYLFQAAGIGLFAFFVQRGSFQAERYMYTALILYILFLFPSILAHSLTLAAVSGMFMNLLCGFIAGYYLMKLMTGGTGKVLVITGYFTNHSNNSRVAGFIEELKDSCPEMEVVGVQGSFDDAEEVEKIIVNTMHTIPDLNGILTVSGGQAGIKKAFQSLKQEKRPYVVIYDQTPRNERALRENFADFLIDQNGYVQGYRPPHILADLLQKKIQPPEEMILTDIIIRTKDNL